MDDGRLAALPEFAGNEPKRERDTSDDDMDVFLDQGKLESENLHLKQKIPELKEADTYMDCDNERDTSDDDMNVFLDQGKLESDNLRLKKKIPEPQEADAYMDCSNERDTSDDDMDVCLDQDKLESDNLLLKKKIPELRADMDCDNAFDIKKKLASKKVLPEETKDEPAAALGWSLNVHHKMRSQKCTMTQASKPNDPYTLNPVILKVTNDVIERIKNGNAFKICLTYNRKQFSDVCNLTDGVIVASGTFGIVSKVRDSQTRNVLIQKQVKKNSQGKFEIEKNEIEVPLQFANLENIARFFGLYFDGDILLYFMEDAGVSLHQLVTDKKMCCNVLVPCRITKIISDEYTAVSYLAIHDIVHRDIKLENVCWNHKTEVTKLIDFGSCRTPQDKIDFGGTTPEYFDPLASKSYYECCVLKNKQFPVHKLEELDEVFAAGLVGLSLFMKKHPLFYFFTGEDSYPDVETRLALIKKNSELTEEQISHLLGAVPMSDTMRVLLQGVLAIDRNKRWRARKAVRFLQASAQTGSILLPAKLSSQSPMMPP
ncbi:hypothetical protein BsWGS_15304 [Bradybaena similaris]